IVHDRAGGVSPARQDFSEPPPSPTNDVRIGAETPEGSWKHGQSSYLFPRRSSGSLYVANSFIDQDDVSNQAPPIPSIEHDDQLHETGLTPQPASEVRATLRSASISSESSVDPLAEGQGSPIRRLALPAGGGSSTAR